LTKRLIFDRVIYHNPEESSLLFYERIGLVFSKYGLKINEILGGWRTVGMNGTRISSLLEKITKLFVICCYCLPIQAKYGSGMGEPNDPYLIYMAE
jgi:hypothetical protein